MEKQAQTERILMAGSGGQGIVLMGNVLAAAAIRRFPFVTFFPAYGAEVRGGTSSCQIVMSNGEIASPVCEVLDYVVLLNQASVERYLDATHTARRFFVNASLCQVKARADVSLIPASEMADRLGDLRIANFIMLGAFLAHCPIVGADEVRESLCLAMRGKPDKVQALNLRALEAGLAI